MPDEVLESEVQESADAEQQTLSFADTVNKITKQLVKGEDGIYHLPEGLDLDEPTRTAVMLEKRRRDTESLYSKASLEARALKAQNEELRKKLSSSFKPSLDEAAAQELEELKYSDPDMWRTRMNELEVKAREKLNEEFSQVESESARQAEIDRREQVLAQFKEENPGFNIDDEILANDVPPRITKKLESGKISFDDFLVEVRDYLSKGKVVKDTQAVTNKPDLSRVGGGASPDPNAAAQDIVSSYANEIY